MPEPFLKAFLFCESAASGSDGTLDVRGVWQQLGVSQLPGRFPVNVFVCWANLENPVYQMEIRVHVPTADEPWVVAMPIETAGNPRLDWMSSARLELAIPAEGDVVFEVLLDGRLMGECRLPVVPR